MGKTLLSDPRGSLYSNISILLAPTPPVDISVWRKNIKGMQRLHSAWGISWQLFLLASLLTLTYLLYLPCLREVGRQCCLAQSRNQY